MTVFPLALWNGRIVPTESLPIQPVWEPWGVAGRGVFTTTRTFLSHRKIGFWGRGQQSRVFRALLAMPREAETFSEPDRERFRLTCWPCASESHLLRWAAELNAGDVCIRINVVKLERGAFHTWAVARPLPSTPQPTKLSISAQRPDFDRREKMVAQDWRRSAEREAESKGAWDVLSVDDEGLLCDTARANLLLRFGSQWVTPEAFAMLEGVVRQALHADGLIEQMPLTVDHLWQADEIAVCNSVRGIVPIHEVEGRPFVSTAACHRLQEWFETQAAAHDDQ